METIRLNKYLSEKGICSRREADRLVESGKVLVNGVPAVVGMKVTPDDEIMVNEKLVSRKQTKFVLLAVNKPRGVVCTTAAFAGETNIVELVDYPDRVYPIGRLDKDSEGLILMTNQGGLVNGILKGSKEHEKEYIVKVDKPVTEELLDKFRNGMKLTELDAETKPCICRRTGEKEFHIILTQGLNRQIRRMCDAAGLQVSSLKRIRVMNILLGNLPRGKFRHVTDEEYAKMQRELGNR